MSSQPRGDELRKSLTFRPFVIFGLAVLVIIVLGLFSQLENWRRDLTTNHASLDARSDDPRMHPIVIAEPLPDVVNRIARWVDQTPLWSLESSEVSDTQASMHLTRTTRIFAWVDDIHVQLSKVDGGLRLDAESKSRVGKADFGQNPRNLQELLAGISAAQQ